MSGSSMCLSSLGHIGGTGFTPIINAPDIAILGATAIQLRPAPAPDGGIEWRKMLPLSLSYDHRAINGAAAARRSEEHTSELQSLMRISYAVFCLKKQKTNINNHNYVNTTS